LMPMVRGRIVDTLINGTPAPPIAAGTAKG
jgi:hypothetical protein